MDKFRMMSQFLQSNQESFMHGICGIMALASSQLYSAFKFNCPCMPEYNYSYGIGVLLIPAIWFFLLGFVLNNNVAILSEEWKRPEGPRGKDPKTFRYMVISVTQRSLISPVVWISVTLMDGKSFLCAYSMDLDISQFGNVTDHGLSEEEFIKLLATIPCEDIYNGQHILSRDAATRYIQCVSQACSWLFLLILTVMAFLVRSMRPCFSQVAFLKTKYWSHYIDIERKVFDEICNEHAKSFAKVCIQQYFESVNEDMKDRKHKQKDEHKEDGEETTKSEEDKLMGIHAQDDINKALWNWHTCKPPLSVKKYKMSDSKKDNAGHKVGYDNASLGLDQKGPENGHSIDNVDANQNGFVNSYANSNTHINQHSWKGRDHLPGTSKKQWAVYYSKV